MSLSTDRARPACLDLVPQWVESLAYTCPVSPGGVHQWLARFVWRSYEQLDAHEQIRVLYWLTRNCGRPIQANEIERTVENIRRKRGGSFVAPFHKPWCEPVPEAIDEIVRSGLRAKELRAESPCRLIEEPEAPCVWLSRLFPLSVILCLGWEQISYSYANLEPYVYRVWKSRLLASWVNRYPSDCNQASLLVPNPSVYTWGYTQDGRRSTRCAEMFPVRRYYLVVEFDFSARARDDSVKTDWSSWLARWKELGLEVKDVCAALIAHLRQYVPLVLVVWSGGKSLQGWFNIRGLEEDGARRFMDYACALNADHATWTTCQLIRMPEAVRPINKNRQIVEYFDPNNLPDF
jgi:hypothetical protein